MLYIIANTQFFLTDFVMQRLHAASGVRVLSHDSRRRGVSKSLAKFIESTFHWDTIHTTHTIHNTRTSRYFDSNYLQQLHAITAHDSVLIFGVENIKELRIVRRHIHTRHITLFTWNPVRDYQQNGWMRALHIRALKNLGMRIVTFDPADAQRYGLSLVEQVYRDVSAWHADPHITPEVDLYFVGQDKGRLALLRALQDVAHRAHLRCYFHITPDKGRHYSPAERAMLARAPLPYADNLAWIARARCLVEVAQPHQSGATVRSLEAAFFGKKLLTTRADTLHDTLYSADRVCIWDARSGAAATAADDRHTTRLTAFLQQPHAAPAASVLARHDIWYWCRQFEQQDARQD